MLFTKPDGYALPARLRMGLGHKTMGGTAGL
jgi:hypothetical protein